jgi:hypothetical protein
VFAYGGGAWGAFAQGANATHPRAQAFFADWADHAVSAILYFGLATPVLVLLMFLAILGVRMSRRSPKANDHHGGGPAADAVRGPGAALIACGIINWLTLTAIALVLAARQQSLSDLPATALAVIGVAGLVMSGLIMLAGFQMRAMRSHGACVVGCLLAMIATPGNIIGLPIGIWALATLMRPDVRSAFAALRRPADDEPEPAGPVQRPTVATVWGVLNMVIAVFLLLVTSLDYFAGFSPDDPIIIAAGDDPLFHTWIALSSPFHYVAAAVLLAAAIGLLLVRPWARRATIAFALYSLASLVIEIPLLFKYYMMPMLADVEVTDGEEAAIAFGLFVTGVLIVTIGVAVAHAVLLLIHMRRPDMVRAFGAAARRGGVALSV